MPTHFEIDPISSVEIGATTKAQLNYTNPPQTVVWTSLNPSIATIDANGVITGQAEGEATIQAVVNGTYVVRQTVTVKTHIHVYTRESIVQKATCVSAGIEKVKCSCGDTKEQPYYLTQSELQTNKDAHTNIDTATGTCSACGVHNDSWKD